MFASVTMSEVRIGDVVVKIRKLSYNQLAKAVEVRQLAAAKMATQLGAEMMKALQDRGGAALAKEQTKKESREDTYVSYDAMSVIKMGVVSWSVDVNLEKGFEDLDESSVKKLSHAIIDLSVVQDNADDIIPKD